jgi:hypothetical protein
MFFNARYFSPYLGRFISADTIVPGAGNPQALNRYSYTFNNPVKYTDPSGHWPGPLTIGVAIAAGFLLWDIFTTPPVETPRVADPLSTDMSEWTLERMKSNAEAPVTQGLRENWTSDNWIQKGGALKAWVSLVGTDAVWDYKVDILEAEARYGIFFPGTTDIAIGGLQLDYDIVANMHFGFVGRAAGFDAKFLKFGAGAAQLKRFLFDTQDPNDFGDCRKSYCDHPFAAWSIDFGSYLYDLYGNQLDELDEEALKQALQQYIEIYGAPPAPPAGK